MFMLIQSLRHGERPLDSVEAISRAIVPVIEALEGRRLLTSTRAADSEEPPSS